LSTKGEDPQGQEAWEILSGNAPGQLLSASLAGSFVALISAAPNVKLRTTALIKVDCLF
jgi:hypothetical protein